VDHRCRKAASRNRLPERHRLDDRQIRQAEERHGGDHAPARGDLGAPRNERSELAAIAADLNAALATGQDELGIVLIQKKNALEASIKVLEQEMEQARTDAQEAKDSLIQVKAEIQKLKDEKDRMLAQMHSAQARLKIQNQLDGLSVDAEVRALDNVREHIKNTVAEAKMGSELRDSDLDIKLARLRQSSGAITARQQLEEMKRARASRPMHRQVDVMRDVMPQN
jgi:phage shock protein A